MLDTFPDTITRWVVTRDGYGGSTFSTPTTFEGRWDDKAEQFRTPSGDVIISKSIILTAQELNIDDYLFLGTSTEADPTILSDALPIQQLGSTPDLRRLKTLITAFL